MQTENITVLNLYCNLTQKSNHIVTLAGTI